mmetsp:Transcript_17262/g.43018  ORF Transcript_17262/g.43018 Transcript_17262/m.43018 type:complete len:268 (-) Transcript_17262:370-1173(-)
MAAAGEYKALSDVKHKILVLSGKGGVGKSTVTAQLATTMAMEGKKVGVLDVDICGPSIPRVLGVEDAQVHQAAGGWVPVSSQRFPELSVMSIGFLLPSKKDAVVWRGPKKTSMIKQFLTDVVWGEKDYLFVDTPPGTSDEHIAVVENLQKVGIDGAVIVTTPQGVSLNDVSKEVNFCKKLKIPIIGVVENMSGFICPNCEGCTDIFMSGGGKKLAERYEIPYLGNVPIDPALGICGEEGKCLVDAFPDSKSVEPLRRVAEAVKTVLV